MNKRIFLLSVLLLLTIVLCGAFLYARGNRENNRENEPKIVQVTGVVRLVGTALFPELVITSNDGEWYIANDEMQKLHDYQHRIVTVEGEETVIELKFASGISAGTRRILRNIRIIR